ncbi:hypothetical protein EHS13_32585 [Paenibacillus psychroresistens]|uniref:Copper amine oxidase-like N-terminal domain-containing protein n=1 Tax=Paenibacillus psychroresistens TaxID=1778678 RepID=A0A6B8RUH9_9BACL|nr:hypothetical protein [Paenibacillus psychroresistens]QGQ99265.1 hypothetical protein EHS13_32585 [Paenibacillus psychroresistens]
MNKKVFIISVSLALILGMGAGVKAGPIIEDVKAYINHDMKMTLNGKEWVAKDPDGITLNPIIYNGSTYLPLRTMGALTGLGIDWDSKSKTILMTTKAEAAVSGEPYKDAIDYGIVEYPLKAFEIYSTSLFDPTEVIPKANNFTYEFTNKLAPNQSVPTRNFFVNYLLFGDAKRLKGAFQAYSISADSYVQYTVSDVATKKKLYSSPSIYTNSAPEKFDIDVTGVNEFQIEATVVLRSDNTLTAMVQALTIVADKSIPESSFEIERSKEYHN